MTLNYTFSRPTFPVQSHLLTDIRDKGDLKFFTQCLSIYQTLHAMPEHVGQEKETRAYIADVLGEIPGWHVGETRESTSIIAKMTSGQAGKTILLRAFMNGTPLGENADLNYEADPSAPHRHVIGHDMECAMMLAYAAILSQVRQYWSGTVILLFQPETETMFDVSKLTELDRVFRFQGHGISLLSSLPLPPETLWFGHPEIVYHQGLAKFVAGYFEVDAQRIDGVRTEAELTIEASRSVLASPEDLRSLGDNFMSHAEQIAWHQCTKVQELRFGFSEERSAIRLSIRVSSNKRAAMLAVLNQLANAAKVSSEETQYLHQFKTMSTGPLKLAYSSEAHQIRAVLRAVSNGRVLSEPGIETFEQHTTIRLIEADLSRHPITMIDWQLGSIDEAKLNGRIRGEELDDIPGPGDDEFIPVTHPNLQIGTIALLAVTFQSLGVPPPANAYLRYEDRP